LAVLLGLVAAVVAALYCFPIPVERSLEAKTIGPWGGHARAASLSDVLPQGWWGLASGAGADSNEQPYASKLRVLEDGKPLPLPHAMHQTIADQGAGRFSHWGEGIVFSASDNTDPAANGRRYSIAYAVVPPWWAVYALLAAAALAWRRSAHESRTGRWLADNRRLVFWTGALLLAVLLNALFLLIVPAPLPHPDSMGYLSWSLFRTLGYPLVLHSYHLVFGTWALLPLFQLNLLLASMLFLAHAIARATGRHAFAWLFLCLTVGFGSMVASAGEILTEPVFAAFAMAHLASLMLFFERGSKAWGLVAGSTLAIAILTKSVAIVLLGPLLLVLVFLRDHRRALLATVFVPALVAWLAPSVYNYARMGMFESSIAGPYALAGHVAWAMKPHPGDAHAVEAALVEKRLKPILDKRPASFPTIGAYVDYTANEYNTLLWGNLTRELQAHFVQACSYQGSCTWALNGTECECQRTMNRALLGLSKEAIAAEPAAFAYHVMAHDYGMWRDVLGQSGDLLGAAQRVAYYLPQAYGPPGSYATVLAPIPTFATEGQRAALVSRIEESTAKRAIDLAVLRDPVETLARAGPRLALAFFAVGLFASLIVFRFARASAAAKAFCYCALCLNAYCLGTALAQPSILRYAWAAQGLLAAMLTLGAWLAWDLIRSRVLRLARDSRPAET
jgi:hypothetical protein